MPSSITRSGSAAITPPSRRRNLPGRISSDSGEKPEIRRFHNVPPTGVDHQPCRRVKFHSEHTNVNFLSLIENKRGGKTLTSAEIQQFVRDFTAGVIPDYQMAALLMAIYFCGLDTAETVALTLAMRDSGEILKFPRDPQRPLVDKHSSGGI